MSHYTFKRDKDCKGSVRYSTDDPRAPTKSVYLSREWLAHNSPVPVPDNVVLTFATSLTPNASLRRSMPAKPADNGGGLPMVASESKAGA